MADDRADVRIPKITDMPAGEAYAFLLHQIGLYRGYMCRAENARTRGLIEREAQLKTRAMLVYRQITHDVYTLTLGAPLWEVQS